MWRKEESGQRAERAWGTARLRCLHSWNESLAGYSRDDTIEARQHVRRFSILVCERAQSVLNERCPRSGGPPRY